MNRQPVCRMERSMIDVTSMHRPDLSWAFTDAAGHFHVWHEKDSPHRAVGYSAVKHYEVPTTVWEKTGTEMWEDDDEPHDIGHYICRLCGQEIIHGFTADTNTQYVPGLIRYYVDDQLVDKDTYMKALYGGQ